MAGPDSRVCKGTKYIYLLKVDQSIAIETKSG